METSVKIVGRITPKRNRMHLGPKPDRWEIIGGSVLNKSSGKTSRIWKAETSGILNDTARRADAPEASERL